MLYEYLIENYIELVKEYKCNIQEYRNTRHFCSEECRQQYKENNWLTLNCDQCGKEFRREKYYIERMKGDKHFCCKECYDQYQRESKYCQNR